MAQPHPMQVNHDTTLYPQYYHCVIKNIPLDMATTKLVDHLVVRESSATVQALAALGRQICLHQLYTYKEPLRTKFSYLGFFLQCTPEAALDEDTKKKVHTLVKQWISQDLRSQLQAGSMGIGLAQPPECYHARPFLDALRSSCSIASSEVCADPVKIETFVLSRVSFNVEGANAAFNPTWARYGESYASGSQGFPANATWAPVGAFSVSCLTPEEILWLKRNCTAFPPVSITNGDVATAHVEGDALVKFFREHLSPLITVVE